MKKKDEHIIKKIKWGNFGLQCIEGKEKYKDIYYLAKGEN